MFGGIPARLDARPGQNSGKSSAKLEFSRLLPLITHEDQAGQGNKNNHIQEKLHMHFRGLAISCFAASLCLLSACATVVADDYSPEFNGNYAVSDDSGDQPLVHKVLKIQLQGGAGSVIVNDSDRPEVFLTRCVSMLADFRNSHQQDVHEMRCVGSDRFIYVFIHGKPGLILPEALTMKIFKDRHDVTSETGYAFHRYIPNMMNFSYTLSKQDQE